MTISQAPYLSRFYHWFGAVLSRGMLILACLSQSGCGSPTQNADVNLPSPFFDLKAFFNREIERLQNEQPRVRKTVGIDGKKETQILDSLNYVEDLNIFLQADINRSAWWDKYAVDSTLAEGKLQSIRYAAKTEDLKTRSLIIDFSGDQVRQVEIENRTDGPTARLNQHLVYKPAWGYHIQSSQKVTFSRPQEMTIDVVFER